MGRHEPDIHLAAAHEGQGGYVFLDQFLQDRARIRACQCEPRSFLAQIADADALCHMIHEPAHVPLSQVITAHDPPRAVAPVQ